MYTVCPKDNFVFIKLNLFMGFKISHLKGKSEIIDLAKFVIMQNFINHQKGKVDESYENDLKEIHEEEVVYYENSKIFISKNEKDEINGSIRVVKWNYRDILPIQKIFNINPIEIIGNSPIRHVWHIGRFAVNKNIKSSLLFKKLMIAALSQVCMHENSVVFAECDSKLLRIMNAMGIKTIQIGDAVNYLGSETIPVCIYFEGVIDFYTRNKMLFN